MREIKFRVWDKEKKEMIYQDEHTAFCFADGFVGVDWDEEGNYEYREWSWKGGLGCVVMQYTGLRDKNGKEIYEGDVIRGKFKDGESKGIVFWGESNMHNEDILTWCVALETGIYWLDRSICGQYEVIGNICENSKLLEDKKFLWTMR